MSRGQFGFKADRLAIGGDCLVEIALVSKLIGEKVVSFRIVRPDADCLAMGGDGTFEVTQLFQCVAEVAMGLGIGRV